LPVPSDTGVVILKESTFAAPSTLKSFKAIRILSPVLNARSAPAAVLITIELDPSVRVRAFAADKTASS